jgi:hypothetical protein
LLGLLVVAGLGALAAIWFLYRPQADALARSQEQLEQAQQKISDLESEIVRLNSLDNQNKALQADLENANQHIMILSALSQVNTARLALATEDPATARASLMNTSRTLNELANLAQPEQGEVLAAMQSRLELALEGIDNDAFAAQSDLGVLATNLERLENILISGP